MELSNKRWKTKMPRSPMSPSEPTFGSFCPCCGECFGTGMKKSDMGRAKGFTFKKILASIKKTLKEEPERSASFADQEEE